MVLARKLLVVLMVLTALACSAAYFATEMWLTDSAENARSLGWIVFGVMTALSIGLVVLIWRSLAGSLRRIRSQLEQFEKAERIGMIMIDANDELAELVAGINHYLTGIKSRFAEDHYLHKELELQAHAAEAERRQTEAVVFSISEAVLVTNQYDELLMANEAAQKLFGFSLSDCYRRLIDQVIDDDGLLELIHNTRADKNTRTKKLIERDDPAGNRTLSLQVILSCVLDNNGDVLGVVVVIHDVTAEEELARMKDDFVNSVSHELKTPLTSISAYSEMLANDEAQTDETRRKFARIIQEQTYRLDRLINDMLDISRIESGAWEVRWDRLDLERIADDVITTIRPQAQEKDIRLELTGRKGAAEESEPTEVWGWGDRDMIFQAVMNLLSNAIKYSAEHQTVTVRLWTQPTGGSAIAVEDEGAGIPMDCLEHIFEKFYRVEQNKQMADGTGLGLSLVRQIVETAHGGTVAVKSSANRGSTFTLFLPAGGRREAEHAECPKEGVGSR